MALKRLHIETPLIESIPLSRRVKGRVWLKMEALQPTGSFKLRGIGRACIARVDRGATELVSSSGGNAGIAVAFCGRKLGVPVTVVVPESTAMTAIEKIRQEGARVVVKGHSWQEAHQYSLGLAGSAEIHVHPFDDPDIWMGHSTIVDEVRGSGVDPDMVVLSVGGGGLLSGIIEGLHRNGMPRVPILAMETRGAHSLWASIQAGRHLELEKITSIATSLGAKKVAENAFLRSLKHPVISRCVSDGQAIEACLKFADDHRLLVEPACGASLSAVYDPLDCLAEKRNIVVVVCGGAGVSLGQLIHWKKQFL